MFDQTAEPLAGVHFPLLSLHDRSGADFLDVGGGITYTLFKGVGGPSAALRLRFDNVYHQWRADSVWANEHLRTLPLGPVEFGATVGYVFRLGFSVGAFLSIPIGAFMPAD